MKLRLLIIIAFTAIQLNATSQTYEVNLDDRNATIDLTNEAAQKIEGNNATEAIILLTKAIAIDSTYRNSYLALYKAYSMNKDYSATAISNFKKANRIFKEDDELCFYLGELYRMNNNLMEALYEYNAAIQYSKKNGEGFFLVYSYYTNRGICFMKLEMYDSAIADFNKALSLKPNSAAIRVNRGTCLNKKGDRINACIDWKYAVENGIPSAAKYVDTYCKNREIGENIHS